MGLPPKGERIDLRYAFEIFQKLRQYLDRYIGGDLLILTKDVGEWCVFHLPVLGFHLPIDFDFSEYGNLYLFVGIEGKIILSGLAIERLADYDRDGPFSFLGSTSPPVKVCLPFEIYG